jgi:hypothetical protein
MLPYIKRSAIWPDPRLKPPFGAVEIDWSHPLARGLVSCFLLNEGGGSPLDLATGLAAVDPQLPGYVGAQWSVGNGGVYFKNGNAVAAFDAADGTVVDITSEDFSIACDIYGASGDSSSVARYVSHIKQGVGGQATGWEFTNDLFSGSVALQTSQSNGSSQSTVAAIGTLTNGRLTRCIGTRSGTTGTLYIDGVEPGYRRRDSHQNPEIVASTPYRSGASAIGGGFDVNDGVDRILFYRNRVLSRSDALWLYKEPFCLLRPIIRRRYWEPRRFLLGSH